MRYILDTNIFLFYVHDREELDSEVLTIIEDYGNTLVISSESIQEIAALVKSGRITIKGLQTFTDIKESLDGLGIEIRYVAEAHLKTLYKLEPAPNHSDPADLMIISQAITEGIPLISSDNKFPLYETQGLKFVHNNRRAAARRR